MKLFIGAFSLLSLLGFSSVQAGTIDYGTYQLNNHPDAAIADPGYGLRLDGLLDGNSSSLYTFDFNDSQSDVKMTWDGTEISIFGDVWGGLDTGSSYGGTGNEAARLWTLDFTYSANVFEAGDQSYVKVDDIDFANSGTISSDVGIFDLKDYSGNNSYNFQLGFGHRGFAGISGWGWLNHCGAEGTNIGASCDSHLSASDFLFTAEKIEVPEPSTLAILMAGLAGLMIRRRKR